MGGIVGFGFWWGGVVDLGDVGCGCVGVEDGGLEYGGGIVGVCRCR